MGHGSVAEEIKRRRGRAQVDGHLDRGGGRALPLVPRRRRALHGPGDLDGGAGRARLGHRAGVRRVHALPRRARLHRGARWSAPTAGSTAASPGTASTRPPGQLLFGIVQGGVYEDLRAESTAYVAGAGVDGIAIGGSLGQSKEQMREVVGWSLRGAAGRRPPRHLLGIGDVDDIVHAVGAGIDTFDCATPTRLARHGTALVHDPDAPLAARPHQERATGRAASRSPRDCACPACREHTRGLPALPHARRRADRQAAAHPPQPDLHGAADARAARGDRRAASTPTHAGRVLSAGARG